MISLLIHWNRNCVFFRFQFSIYFRIEIRFYHNRPNWWPIHLNSCAPKQFGGCEVKRCCWFTTIMNENDKLFDFLWNSTQHFSQGYLPFNDNFHLFSIAFSSTSIIIKNFNSIFDLLDSIQYVLYDGSHIVFRAVHNF